LAQPEVKCDGVTVVMFMNHLCWYSKQQS